MCTALSGLYYRLYLPAKPPRLWGSFSFLFFFFYISGSGIRDMKRDEVACKNARKHCHLETFNTQTLHMQVSLKYLLKMYELTKQAKADSTWKFKRASEVELDHPRDQAKRLTDKEGWELGPKGNLVNNQYKMLPYWNIFKNCCHWKVFHWLGVFSRQSQRNWFKAWFYSTFSSAS